MRTVRTSGALKALLLAGGACSVLWAAPVVAQSAGEEEEASSEADDTSTSIIVTGSRIQRQDYSANSPMVTVDEEFLRQSATSAIEQQLNKLPQFVVSQSSTAQEQRRHTLPRRLRISSRMRPTPRARPRYRCAAWARTARWCSSTAAAARPAMPRAQWTSRRFRRRPSSGSRSSPAALRRLTARTPSPGVTNFILKKDFQGLELDAQMGISQYRRCASTTRSRASWGRTSPTGAATSAWRMSMNTRERGPTRRDRPWYQ